MMDPQMLATIYRQAHDRAIRSKQITDPNVIALLAVYDEGWADGYARGDRESRLTGPPDRNPRRNT